VTMQLASGCSAASRRGQCDGGGGGESPDDDPHETNTHGAAATIEAQSTNAPTRCKARAEGSRREGRSTQRAVCENSL